MSREQRFKAVSRAEMEELVDEQTHGQKQMEQEMERMRQQQRQLAEANAFAANAAALRHNDYINPF